MAALHAAPTLRTVADLDVEAAYDGVHRREIFLILRGHAGHFDGAAAGGTRLGDAGRMGLVDPRRTPAASLPPVPCTGSSAWTPAAALPPVLGEGRGLSAAGPPGGVELLLEVFAAPLPPVAVADSAYQVLVQLDVLPLELLDALVSRLLLPPGRLRPAASAAPPGHTPCIGTCARSCTPLRGFSRPYPVTEDLVTIVWASSLLVFLQGPESLIHMLTLFLGAKTPLCTQPPILGLGQAGDCAVKRLPRAGRYFRVKLHVPALIPPRIQASSPSAFIAVSSRRPPPVRSCISRVRLGRVEHRSHVSRESVKHP